MSALSELAKHYDQLILRLQALPDQPEPADAEDKGEKGRKGQGGGRGGSQRGVEGGGGEGGQHGPRQLLPPPGQHRCPLPLCELDVHRSKYLHLIRFFWFIQSNSDGSILVAAVELVSVM